MILPLTLAARSHEHLPIPTEAEAAALFAPIKVFSLACTLAGVFIDTFLLGVFSVLLVRYFRSHNSGRDTIWTYLCVGGSTVGNLVVTGSNWHIASHRFVYHFGEYQPFFLYAQCKWYPFVDCVAAIFSQAFFAHRAFRLLGGNWIVLGSTAVMMSTSLGSTILIFIELSSVSSVLDAARVFAPTLLWLATTMAADLIITFGILAGLIRSRTDWERTNRLIARLIRVTLEAQIPPTILSIIFLAQYSVNPSSFLGKTLLYIQSKLYVISLLYSLNARSCFAAAGNVTMNTPSGSDYSTQATTIQVHVETEKHETQIDPFRPPTSLNRLNARDTVDDDSKSATLYSSVGQVSGDDVQKV